MMNKIQKCLQYYLLPAVALCIAMNSASCGCNPFAFGDGGGDKNNNYELVANPDIKGLDVATVKLKTPADGAKYGDIALSLKSSDDCKWFEWFCKGDRKSFKPFVIRIRLSDFLGKGANEEMPAEVELKFGASAETLAWDEDRELCLCISNYTTRRVLVDSQPVVNWKQDKAVFTIEVNPSPCVITGTNEQVVTITITKQSGRITDNALLMRFDNNSFFEICPCQINDDDTVTQTGVWVDCPFEMSYSNDPNTICELSGISDQVMIKAMIKAKFPSSLTPTSLRLSLVNARNSSITYLPPADLVKWNP